MTLRFFRSRQILNIGKNVKVQPGEVFTLVKTEEFKDGSCNWRFTIIYGDFVGYLHGTKEDLGMFPDTVTELHEEEEVG